MEEGTSAGSSGVGKRKCVYTAAAVNRASHVADWASIEGTNELVYASHKNLVIARNVGVSVRLVFEEEAAIVVLIQFDNSHDILHLPNRLSHQEDT